MRLEGRKFKVLMDLLIDVVNDDSGFLGGRDAVFDLQYGSVIVECIEDRRGRAIAMISSEKFIISRDPSVYKEFPGAAFVDRRDRAVLPQEFIEDCLTKKIPAYLYFHYRLA